MKLGFTKIGVPFWGPDYMGILLVGDLHWGSPIFVTLQVSLRFHSGDMRGLHT